MPSVDQLSKLFRALASHEYGQAEEIASRIASHEEKKGHRTAAQLLKGSLVPNGTRSRDGGPVELRPNGTATVLSSALFNRSSRVSLSDVFLRREARARLQEIISEFKLQDRLKSLGIRRRSRLILHGPPGCGKSLAAQALANELGLPLFVVRFDSIIGAYLGQTATHLRHLFHFAEGTPCVLLFDEVDALGRRRGSPTDVGELDRIVIALMQELELSELRGFVLATSNIPDSLDPALWRRFDLAVHLPRPTRTELLRFAHSEAKTFRLKLSIALRRQVGKLSSFAEVEKAVEDEARRIALRGI